MNNKIVEIKEDAFFYRLGTCVRSAMPKAIKTSLWFLKLTIPISFIVTILYHFGVLGQISEVLSPVFKLIGLRGEAALVYISSVFLNVYSAIAVITTLNFTIREMTILAIMSLIAHNLIVETAVQKKTGSKVWHIVVLRIITSIIAAVLLNFLLPTNMGQSNFGLHTVTNSSFGDLMIKWSISALKLSLKIVILISLLMILQKILLEFKITDILTTAFKPLLKIMGLPESTTLMWLVANLLGLAYGSVVMIDEVEGGRITRQDADLLNFHIAISHSNLEDLLLFAAIGISVWWLLLPRLAIAMVVVWGRRWAIQK